MKKEGVRYVIGAMLFAFVLSLGFSQTVKNFIQIPTSVTVFEGEQEALFSSVGPLRALATVASEDSHAFSIAKNSNSTYLNANERGSSEAVVKAGGLPLKSIDVSVLPEIKVVPGGQSIGVKLNTEGVLVVGHHLIETINGQQSPGESAGIEVGDMITKINGVTMRSMRDVTDLVQDAGEEKKELSIEVKRDQKDIQTILKPQKAKGEHSYRLGLYIRDSAAGVGTMTFYEPESKKFGALGHVISDMDTHKPIVVHDGEVMRSSVTSIEKGLHGDPGEKLASISKEHNVLGNIEKNSRYGIFGTLKNDKLENHIADEPMAISMASEVEEGPAKILTVVNGEDVEEFEVEVVSSVTQTQPATKGMVIKVTDPKLLEATGGIVQGMSGSPIIQNDKLIGAVTHVFVNDPTSGYGGHIGWMLEEAGIHTGLNQAKAS
ncbi:SpoIVB peptidase [Shouchella shacheensis]|uniref:SpoIVB peptidase n=1 Tax=Shouchella shacheensis TaxID=1649580 RepID=UPI0007403DD7|nr:SpoIVB peptidase [Shouchella shacheensis]